MKADTFFEWITIAVFVLVALVLVPSMLSGCAAKANNVTIQSMIGPNRTTCYLIVQGEEVKGGNCQ
jgi:hypothetical protein